MAAAQFLHKRAVLCVSRRGNGDLDGVMRPADDWILRNRVSRTKQERAHRFVTPKILGVKVK